MATAYLFPDLYDLSSALAPAVTRPEVQWRLFELLPLLGLAPAASSGLVEALGAGTCDLHAPHTAATALAVQLGVADGIVRRVRPHVVAGIGGGATTRDVFAGRISFADAVAMLVTGDRTRGVYRPPMLPVYAPGGGPGDLIAGLVQDRGVTRLIDFGGTLEAPAGLQVEVRPPTAFWNLPGHATPVA